MQQTETITKPHKQSKPELGSPICRWMHLSLGEHCRREGRKAVREEEQGAAVRLCLLAQSETAPIKSHQCDCISLSGKKIASIDMTKWMRGKPRNLSLTQRTTGT